MKYLELLTQLRQNGQNVQAIQKKLQRICNRDGSEKEFRKCKMEYMRYSGQQKALKGQAEEMIRASSDIEVMRALYLRHVERVPWENIGRRLLSNRSEMELRIGAYQYIKQNCAHPEVYSDCF